jgi:hypothetical protein
VLLTFCLHYCWFAIIYFSHNSLLCSLLSFCACFLSTILIHVSTKFSKFVSQDASNSAG